jgi:hypothetical protein
MANGSTRPARDPITAAASSSSGSPKRSDLLNNKPRTTSAGRHGPGFTSTDDKNGWPCPSNPYGKD